MITKWFWAHSEKCERWVGPFDSKDEAIQEALDPEVSIFVATGHTVYPTINADSILEDMLDTWDARLIEGWNPFANKEFVRVLEIALNKAFMDSCDEYGTAPYQIDTSTIEKVR